jgi:predicted Na+-dependent transporter
MNDLVMLSVLCALFMFFAMCIVIIRFIGTWLEKSNSLNSKIDVYFLLIVQVFSLICLLLSLLNIIDYTLI